MFRLSPVAWHYIWLQADITNCFMSYRTVGNLSAVTLVSVVKYNCLGFFQWLREVELSSRRIFFFFSFFLIVPNWSFAGSNSSFWDYFFFFCLFFLIVVGFFVFIYSFLFLEEVVRTGSCQWLLHLCRVPLETRRTAGTDFNPRTRLKSHTVCWLLTLKRTGCLSSGWAEPGPVVCHLGALKGLMSAMEIVCFFLVFFYFTKGTESRVGQVDFSRCLL